jgi:dUTPase
MAELVETELVETELVANQEKEKTFQFLKKNYAAFMHFRIFLDSQDPALKQKYVDAVQKHNEKLVDNYNIDAGFDLYSPLPDADDQNEHLILLGNQINKIDFKIVGAAKMVHGDCMTHNTGYYMYPRSSLSKTPLRLANSVGIIDSAYRGHIMGMFDLINDSYKMDHYTRIVQICAPSLVPIYVEMVDSLEELGTTERGSGGFGSTGQK